MSMIVGILQVEIGIEGATSLKDKRRVVRSIKDRLHREHQVSVAEVDTLENMAIATLGITMASNEVTYCQSVMDKLIDKLSTGRGVRGGYVLNDHSLQILTGK